MVYIYFYMPSVVITIRPLIGPYLSYKRKITVSHFSMSVHYHTDIFKTCMGQEC